MPQSSVAHLGLSFKKVEAYTRMFDFKDDCGISRRVYRDSVVSENGSICPVSESDEDETNNLEGPTKRQRTLKLNFYGTQKFWKRDQYFFAPTPRNHRVGQNNRADI